MAGQQDLHPASPAEAQEAELSPLERLNSQTFAETLPDRRAALTFPPCTNKQQLHAVIVQLKWSRYCTLVGVAAGENVFFDLREGVTDTWLKTSAAPLSLCGIQV